MPPWATLQRLKNEQAFSRSQQANKSSREKFPSFRSRMAAIKAELERKITEREAREKSPKDALPRPSEPVQEAAAGETALPTARRDAPDNE